MIAAETRERVPVDRAIAGDVVGRTAVFVFLLAILLLLGRLCDDAEETQSEKEHEWNADTSHLNPGG